MSRKNLLGVSVVALLLLLMVSCSYAAGVDPDIDTEEPVQQQDIKLDYGTIDGSTYKNSYFKMMFVIPDDWQVQNKEVIYSLKEKGKAALAGENNNLKAALDASEKDSLALIVIFRYPLGYAVNYNQSIACVAEKVSLFPGIKKGSDYLYSAKKLMENTQIKYEFGKDFYSEIVNGTTFDVMEIKVDIGKMEIMQKYYSTILNGYALSFIISYTSDEELASLNAIINSIKFGE